MKNSEGWMLQRFQLWVGRTLIIIINGIFVVHVLKFVQVLSNQVIRNNIWIELTVILESGAQ